MLLQIDASPHDWLEGRGPRLSMVGAIDDVTNVVPWGVFRDQEDAEGYFAIMHQVVLRHGIPIAVYCDWHSIFHMTKDKELTLEEQLTGRRRPTQFGRLLDELGVETILAHSPQTKGRIKRLMSQREASTHTIASYRDTFRLLLGFVAHRTGDQPGALDVGDIDAPLVAAFLDHLEQDRHNTVRTRNNRLAAIPCSATPPCATRSMRPWSSVCWPFRRRGSNATS